MKNKKFILGVCLCFLLVLGVCIFLFIPQNSNEKKPQKKQEVPLFKFINQDIDLSNVSYLEIIKYTEGGDLHDRVENEEIEDYYNKLSQMIIKEETDMSCDDNTTVYIFHMKDNQEISIEIECEFLVYNNKRYLIK